MNLRENLQMIHIGNFDHFPINQYNQLTNLFNLFIKKLRLLF